MYSEEELIEQEKEFTGILRYVFLPILCLALIGLYFKENSKEYIERQYKEANQYSFSGVVYEKKVEGGN